LPVNWALCAFIAALEEMMELFTDLWSFIGSNTSEIIAFSALGLATWQGYAARQHNKLSVSPHISFSSVFLDEVPHFSINIKNNGLGTAIISDYKVMLDGVIQKDTGKRYITEVCRQLDIPQRYTSAGRYFDVGDSVSAGDELNVIRIVLKEGECLDRELAHKELKRIQLIVTYKSLYGVSYESKFHST
jgi:hypothetical protein